MADDDDVTEVAQVADVLRSATMPPIHLPIATTQARALLASPWLARRDARIRAEAVRAFGDTLGVHVGDEDDDWWRGYRQGQREALHAAREHANRIEREGQ